MLTKLIETHSNIEYEIKYANMFNNIIKNPSDKLLNLLVET